MVLRNSDGGIIGHRARAGRLLALALAAYALHFAWEMAHTPLFETMRHLPFRTATAWCARAAGWDVVISAFAYLAAALAARFLARTRRRRIGTLLFFYMTFGLVITVVIEKWAVGIGRWTYTAAMPTLAGVGLSPLLQWIVVPGAIAAIAITLARPPRSPH